MKDLIVIIGTVILGVFIFNMMVGSREDSLRGISERAMRKTLDIYGGEVRIEKFDNDYGCGHGADDIRIAVRG